MLWRTVAKPSSLAAQSCKRLMLNALVILVTVLIALQVIMAVFLLRVMTAAKQTIGSLNKRIELLDKRCNAQEEKIAELRKVAATTKGIDPLVEALDLLSGMNKRNAVQTLVALGARLFRSYSAQRRAKPLPVRGRGEVKT